MLLGALVACSDTDEPASADPTTPPSSGAALAGCEALEQADVTGLVGRPLTAEVDEGFDGASCSWSDDDRLRVLYVTADDVDRSLVELAQESGATAPELRPVEVDGATEAAVVVEDPTESITTTALVARVQDRLSVTVFVQTRSQRDEERVGAAALRVMLGGTLTNADRAVPESDAHPCDRLTAAEVSEVVGVPAQLEARQSNGCRYAVGDLGVALDAQEGPRLEALPGFARREGGTVEELDGPEGPAFLVVLPQQSEFTIIYTVVQGRVLWLEVQADAPARGRRLALDLLPLVTTD